MKKDIAIKEDNKARQFAAVQRVVTNNMYSGTSLWVPKEHSETDELTVTENGVYYAYDDDVYGYSQIVVNVSSSLNDRSETEKATSKITGTNPDTGDTELYGVDEDGNLTKEVYPSGLPAAIHIVIEPTKKSYDNGDTLDFSGIHVYLLDGEGHQWTSDEYPTGEIPFSELIFPTTIADISGSSDTYTYETENGSVIAWRCRCFTSNPHTTKFYDSNIEFPNENFPSTHKVRIAAGIACYLYVARNGNAAYLMVDGSASTDVRFLYVPNDESGSWMTGTMIDRRSVGAGEFGNPIEVGMDEFSVVPASQVNPSGSKVGDLIKVTHLEIPVQWVCSDGRTLEDSYDITVKGGNPSANGNGESSSGGAHTGGDF